ncbi:MAG: ABC transporter permease [Gemmatimonadetes bacterium]|nr:ABC transporter permease [Gemmatimonadota bacterium]MBP7551681.1 ABC transporter permease [Gemmatimonadaceae bacterium]
MRAALLSRIGQAALVVLLVVATCFTLIRLAPGDPFFRALDEATVTPEQRAEQRARFGYDRPVVEQFVRYATNIVRGEFGWSHSRGEPVSRALVKAIPNSMLLAGTALVLAFTAGIAIGAWQGWRHGTLLARASDALGLVLVSIPDFVLAVLAVMGPALAWRLFPVGGMRTEFGPGGVEGVVDLLHHLVLPALTLAIPIGAVAARLQRAAMLGVRDADFVRAARARGATETRIVTHHALRNALVPVLAYAGVQVSALMGGVVIIEQVFDWPGMGRLMLAAVQARDYPLVAGAVLVSSLGTVLGTMAADVALLWADPRQRSIA